MINPNTATADELRAELIRLQSEAPNKGFRVSTKGALSLYGLGRFPVTLYASQWRKVVALVKSGDVEKQLAENAGKLSEKE